MVHTAGQAKTKLINPNPNDAKSAWILSAPAREKIVDE
jgi:hypothetical protein